VCKEKPSSVDLFDELFSHLFFQSIVSTRTACSQGNSEDIQPRLGDRTNVILTFFRRKPVIHVFSFFPQGTLVAKMCANFSTVQN
jgi:hypothetical protein